MYHFCVTLYIRLSKNHFHTLHSTPFQTKPLLNPKPFPLTQIKETWAVHEFIPPSPSLKPSDFSVKGFIGLLLSFSSLGTSPPNSRFFLCFLPLISTFSPGTSFPQFFSYLFHSVFEANESLMNNVFIENEGALSELL